ncbi:outer membrane beta-barrel family protein [Ekhidna sp.]|uniref:outer membrane beta-barrel family protein n=1 Tax=Ekhidna sp. TaxID=2608089 RepID=UPI00329A3051
MKGLLFSATLLFVTITTAQNISGTITDSGGEKLFAATVMLLHEQDSVLASFAMTDEQGVFVIENAKTGKYVLRVNYVGYEAVDKRIEVKNIDINVGTIQLDPTELEEVVVEGVAIPITMKKDTIEYNAAAFATKTNAVVEDLLKKLPGMEVERDGTIKSQGETVNKVLVDGKEFFGDDPKMATKNLPADAVNKVQVFDQKSEFSQFSGIDDGNDEKTINLTLKEDHKKGTFGTVSGGYGTDERYALSANINQFREDNQFSFIGKHNNINQQGFSTGEYISFMGGLGNLMSGGGGFRLGGGGATINNGLSDGFVNSTSAGLNFNRDLSEKTEVRASYLFSRIENITAKETDRTNFVNDETFDTEESANSISAGNNHSLNLNVKHKFDKSQDIQIRNTLSFQNGDVSNITNTINRNATDTTSSVSDYNSMGTGHNINSRLIYRKKFPRIGRTFVTELSVNSQNNDSEYFLNTSVNNGEAVTNQEQQALTKSNTLGIEVAYTEPLGKNKYLELRYERNVTKGTNDKDFYDISGGGRVFDSSLSSIYDRDYKYNRAGLSFNYALNDFRVTTGANYQFSSLTGELPEQGQTFENEFNRTLPFARINYDITQSLGLSFNYNTRLNTPSITQLQPVVDNSNPLNIYEGNPNLDAEYVHSARLNFRYFDQFTSTSLFSFFNASYTLDNIVTSREVDNQNRTTSRPVNADNSLMLTNYTSFSRPIKFAKTRFRISNRLARNEGFAIVNGVTTETITMNNTVSFSLENMKKKVVDWSVGTNYTVGSTSGSNESSNQDYTNWVYYVDATLFLPKKWSVGSIYDYNIYKSASFAGDQEVQLWEASIQKEFLKNERAQLKLSVFDILNQNRGVNRTTDFNYIQEERIASIGTYYMVTFTYRLSEFAQRKGFIRMQGNRRG